MGSGVFVSYRRDDDPGWAGRIRDSLANRFGESNVFFDVESIRGGQRWEEALDEALAASGTLVLVIGPRWLTCLQERQASGEEDVHLHEITTALDRGINVYPVRVQGAPMPDLADLPEELRTRLPAIQWMEIYDRLFSASMERVIEDLEGALGLATSVLQTSRSTTAATAALRTDATVGPWGTDAEFHEIADAVAAVAPGGMVRVRAGRYLKQVILDRPVAIASEGRGDVILDSELVPCLWARTTGAVVRGLIVKSSAPDAGLAIRVDQGDLLLDDVQVQAHRPGSAGGIEVLGATTRLTCGGASITGASIGLLAADGAVARVERLTIGPTTEHAVVIRSGADPVISGSSLAGTDLSTVLVEDGGRGTFNDCVLRHRGGATVEVRTDGAPTIRGSRGTDPGGGGLAQLPDRLTRSRAATGPAPDDPDRGGWTVLVADGGRGSFLDADLAEVHTETDGAPTFEGCAIGVVVGDGAGRGTFARSEIGRIELRDGADPTFRDGCTIAPERGVKITIEVHGGARGTFEDCEIIGRNVRDGSPDPAVLSDGGAPTLRRCAVKNPGEGAISVQGGGAITIVGGEVRSSVSGPCIVVDEGTAEVSDGCCIRTGVRVGTGGGLRIDGGELHADPVSGAVVEVLAGGGLTVRGTEVRGAGFAAARKVGRWIEQGTAKVRGKATSVPGSSAAVRVATEATATFTDVSLTGIDPAELTSSAPGATFERSQLDGSPLP